MSFPGVTVTGQARKANLQGAKFNDFRAWVIAAKEEGVTDAGLSTYITKKLTDFESDALNHPDLKQAMGVMGVSSLEGATITGTFSQNMAAGAPAASAGDVDPGADGTVGAETVIDPYEQLAYRGMVGVGEEAFTLDDLYSQLGEARRVRDERREEQRREAERARREREAAAAADGPHGRRHASHARGG